MVHLVLCSRMDSGKKDSSHHALLPDDSSAAATQAVGPREVRMRGWAITILLHRLQWHMLAGATRVTAGSEG